MTKFKTEGESSLGPHVDYNKNLASANNFIKKMLGKFQNGVRVEVSSESGESNRLMVFSYTPPLKSVKGRYAISVSLHDGYYETRGKVGRAWDSINKIAQEPTERG